MTVRRVIEIECCLCGDLRVYENVTEAKVCGWVRDRWPDGTVNDLCAACAKEVLVDV